MKIFRLIFLTLSALYSHIGAAEPQKGALLLRIPFPSGSLTLDPAKMEDWYSMAVILQTQRGLFRYQPGGDVEPDLVETWQESRDGRRFTFKLGSHQFSDGSPIRAIHVVNSIARIYHVSSSIAADLSYITGIKKFLKSKNLADLGVRALDDKTIEFQLEHPSGLFLKHLAVVDCAVLKLTDFKQSFESKAGIPSSGPYKVIEFSPSQILLEKWRKDRHDSARPPQHLKYFVSDRAPEEAARAGDVDTLDFLTVEDNVKSDLRKSGWKEQVSAVMWEHFLILNPSKLSAEVRNGIQAAVEQENLAESLQGRFEPAWGLIPAGLPGALAKSDWTSIGKGMKGASQKRVEIELKHTGRQALLARAVASNLKKANIEVKLAELANLDDYLGHLTEKSYSAIIGSRGLDYPDGYSVLSYFRTGYEGNYYHVENPEIDAALDRAAMITDLSARQEAYRKLSMLILGHGTIVPLVVGNSWSGLWGPRVAKVPAHPMGFHQLPLESVEMAQ